MKIASKRAGSLFLSAFFFIMAFTVYSIFIRPEIENIAHLRGTLNARSSLFDEQKLINEQVKKLITRFRSVQNLQETASLALPLEERVPELVQQFHVLAGLSNLKLRTITIGSSASKPAGRKISGTPKSLEERGETHTLEANLELTGFYDGMKEFLTLLERNIRITDVRSLKISTPKRKGEEHTFSLSLRSYFYLLEDGAVGDELNNSQ